jgi:uncharacterized OsmC-like protein
MYAVEIASKSGYRFNVKSKDYEFVVDIKGGGITPPDTLLASLGSCMGVYLRKYVEGAKLPVGEFNITVKADLTGEAPHRFKNIHVVIDVKGAALDERHKKALLDFMENCPVHNTLKDNPAIDVTIS